MLIARPVRWPSLALAALLSWNLAGCGGKGTEHGDAVVDPAPGSEPSKPAENPAPAKPAAEKGE